MLRVGLTGGLGSGKSTVTEYFRSLGAEVIEADEMGRVMMEPNQTGPGQRVYDEIVDEFGPEILQPDGRLDRPRIAAIVFGDKSGKRLHALNSIVHPAVITAQADWMRALFKCDPKAIAIVESALIFEVERDARLRGESESVLSYWRRRFDRIIVVTAPDELKIARYVKKISPGKWDEKIATDARSRLSKQLSDAVKTSRADFVLENTGDLASLHMQADAVWRQLVELNNNLLATELLEL